MTDPTPTSPTPTSPTPSGDAVLHDADRSIAAAPLPTPSTLRARQNLAVQSVRFVVLNVRMLKMVLKGHH